MRIAHADLVERQCNIFHDQLTASTVQDLPITTRPIAATDAAAVSDIHVASWRDSYRGMLRDDYLDSAIAPERLAVWTERLRNLAPFDFGFIAAAANRSLGFVFLRGADDPVWGTLLDNLHVLPGFKGQGIGRLLVEAGAREAMNRHPRDRVYLWVFEQNSGARRFYRRLGGHEAERAVVDVPGGGAVAEWRVVWDNPERLLTAASINS